MRCGLVPQHRRSGYMAGGMAACRYLASMTKGSNAINELVEKFNVVSPSAQSALSTAHLSPARVARGGVCTTVDCAYSCITCSRVCVRRGGVHACTRIHSCVCMRCARAHLWRDGRHIRAGSEE
jgi:hypothetical protein